MTQHNIDDEHHPLKPFWNPKDHIEEIVNLPEFEKLYESFQEEPPAFFGNQSAPNISSSLALNLVFELLK